VEPYTSYINFNQARTTPITATAFHPHRMVLGCAAKGDWHINLYHCGNEKVGGAVG
jgi:regulator-associated protein of mTOR